MSVARRDGWRWWPIAAVTTAAMVLTGLPGVGQPARASSPEVSYPEPVVSELPGRRGDGDRFEALDHGDLDGDGIPDLAVLRHDASSTATATSVVALLGAGDGTFTPTYDLPLTTPRSIDGGVVIGEFTGDSVPDLASVTDDAAQVLVHPGVGGGTFGDTTAIPVTAPPSAADPGPHLLRSADLDGDLDADGHADLVAGFSNGVVILRTDGAGGFADPEVQLTDVGTLRDLVVADLDGDGRGDLVAAGTSALEVLTQATDGSFAQSARLPVTSSDPFTGVVAGEFNGDGDLDVVVARNPSRGDSDLVGLLAGAGDGTLAEAVAWEQTPNGLARDSDDHLARDLDGDGHLDALFTAGETVVPVFGDGAGGLDGHA